MRSLNKGEILDLVFVNEHSLDLHFVQDSDSVLRLHIIDFASADNNVIVEHNGMGCSTEIYHLSCLSSDDKVSFRSHVMHNVGNGTSRQMVKFVLQEQAQGDFLGELKILPDAQNVEAHQTNHNLILSSDADMKTCPQLEIYADNVKASHGASTGQLDETALFYMQQRGIDRDSAKRLLITAFMKDIVDSIRDERQRDELMRSIDGVVK